MFIAYLVIAVLVAVALTGSAIAKLTRAEQIVTVLAGVGVPDSWLVPLAACQLAGAIGLLVGLGLAPIGEAAALGVAAYFVVAIGFHLRAGDRNLAPPVALAVLAIAALVLRVLSM